MSSRPKRRATESRFERVGASSSMPLSPELERSDACDEGSNCMQSEPLSPELERSDAGSVDERRHPRP